MLRTLESTDKFVSRTPGADWQIWGHTLTIHRPHPAAEFKPWGIYNRKTGKWGRNTVVTVNEEGKFAFPRR